MVADRADARSLLADYDVAAVPALPDHLAIAGEYKALLDVLQKCEGGVLVQDRAWATERAFKQGFSEGWLLPNGMFTKSVPKDTFADLYSKGLIYVDPVTGEARLDTTVIY